MTEPVDIEQTTSCEPLVLNQETIAAMKAAQRGEFVTFASIDALFDDLSMDDQARDPHPRSGGGEPKAVEGAAAAPF